ncbi:hypothetical protein QJS10_CPB21g00938 [Acorus calamus]|uniref:Uncharacterized protein n=1 Tax=Acorus calamus TaxID=4465 RepID=A0AAV9C5A7_ACOCL|nr:hypothetical protein QJS10_CPB21g00938 [Acorus calamus]
MAMAKGRKSITSYHERFIGNPNYGQGTTATVAAGEDLREEEVWSMMIDHASLLNDGNTVDRSSRGTRWIAMTSHQQHHHTTSSSSRRHQVVGGLSMALEGGNRTVAMRVPEWRGVEDEKEEEGSGGWWVEEEERVAPHEYLARERAQRGRLVGTSVVEGKGRTLKGRDVSRVRDAVWSRTGFSG